MKRSIDALLLCCALLLTHSLHAEQIRDYYAEPGINPFKNTLDQSFHEQIDPFGGTLQLKYQDIKIPGNGGMDINIYRTYTSMQEKLQPHTIMGQGWTMHLGRIVVNAADQAKMCSQGNYSISTKDNPSLELPDGGRELLVLDMAHNYLLTRSRWKARCEIGLSGMIVTSPQGTEYLMDQYEYNNGTVSYYTSKITDLNGNTINVNYKTGFGFTYIDTITSSDGRLVQFSYVDENSEQIRLSAISANGQTWQYSYIPVPTDNTFKYHLARVTRPDKLYWQYDYYSGLTGLDQAGNFSLAKVTYPYGGTIDYTYQKVTFDPQPLITTLPTTAVATKIIGGPGITPGTWSFKFQPAISVDVNNYLDVTTVTSPNGKYVYKHFGYSKAGVDQLWRVGLLEESEIYDLNNNLLQKQTSTWDKQAISNENY